jgi:hypothetical protein
VHGNRHRPGIDADDVQLAAADARQLTVRRILRPKVDWLSAAFADELEHVGPSCRVALLVGGEIREVQRRRVDPVGRFRRSVGDEIAVRILELAVQLIGARLVHTKRPERWDVFRPDAVDAQPISSAGGGEND